MADVFFFKFFSIFTINLFLVAERVSGIYSCGLLHYSWVATTICEKKSVFSKTNKSILSWHKITAAIAQQNFSSIYFLKCLPSSRKKNSLLLLRWRGTLVLRKWPQNCRRRRGYKLFLTLQIIIIAHSRSRSIPNLAQNRAFGRENWM